jgi:hypothetical protein
MKKLQVHPIAKYNLEKPINSNQGRAPRRLGDGDRELQKALAARIEKEIPAQLLLMNPPPHKNRVFHPTEIQKRMVWQMAAMGASQNIIRLAVIDPDTKQPLSDSILVSNFGDIMRHAREQANFTVALKIYELAVGRDAEYDNEGNLIQPSYPPNFDALKWWDRTRGEARKLLDLRTVRHEQEANTVTLVIEGS